VRNNTLNEFTVGMKYFEALTRKSFLGFIIILSIYKVKKVKVFPLQALEAYRVVRCQGSHIV
jgi:hypothetical protein